MRWYVFLTLWLLQPAFSTNSCDQDSHCLQPCRLYIVSQARDCQGKQQTSNHLVSYIGDRNDTGDKQCHFPIHWPTGHSNMTLWFFFNGTMEFTNVTFSVTTSSLLASVELMIYNDKNQNYNATVINLSQSHGHVLPLQGKETGHYVEVTLTRNQTMTRLPIVNNVQFRGQVLKSSNCRGEFIGPTTTTSVATTSPSHTQSWQGYNATLETTCTRNGTVADIINTSTTAAGTLPSVFPKVLHLGYKCKAKYWCTSNTETGSLKWLRVTHGTLMNITGRPVTSVSSITDRNISISLIIDGVRDSDAGRYACMLTSQTGISVECNYVELLVSNDRLQCLSLSNSDVEFGVGSTVFIIACIVIMVTVSIYVSKKRKTKSAALVRPTTRCTRKLSPAVLTEMTGGYETPVVLPHSALKNQNLTVTTEDDKVNHEYYLCVSVVPEPTSSSSGVVPEPTSSSNGTT